MYLRKSTSSRNGKEYEYYFLVEGYRDKSGKVKQRTIAKLGKLSPSEVASIKLALSGKAVASFDDIKLEKSYEYGASRILDDIWDQLGLNQLIDQKSTYKIKMMVINRLIEPKSKNSLVKWYDGSFFFFS